MIRTKASLELFMNAELKLMTSSCNKPPLFCGTWNPSAGEKQTSGLGRDKHITYTNQMYPEVNTSKLDRLAHAWGGPMVELRSYIISNSFVTPSSLLDEFCKLIAGMVWAHPELLLHVHNAVSLKCPTWRKVNVCFMVECQKSLSSTSAFLLKKCLRQS